MTWLRRSRYRWLQAIARFYVSVFRAVPGVVQIFLAYYGLPEIIPALKTWSPEVMVILALGFKYAAYMAETFRAAADSVDAGQWEAATSLQINKWAFFKHVMLPQAAVQKGCKPILVKTGKGVRTLAQLEVPALQNGTPHITADQVQVFDNLGTAADFIITTDN